MLWNAICGVAAKAGSSPDAERSAADAGISFVGQLEKRIGADRATTERSFSPSVRESLARLRSGH